MVYFICQNINKVVRYHYEAQGTMNIIKMAQERSITFLHTLNLV